MRCLRKRRVLEGASVDLCNSLLCMSPVCWGCFFVVCVVHKWMRLFSCMHESDPQIAKSTPLVSQEDHFDLSLRVFALQVSEATIFFAYA